MVGETKVPDTERVLGRILDLRQSNSDNRTHAGTTYTSTGWTESYTAGNKDETIHIRLDAMVRVSSGTGAAYFTIYVDGVAQTPIGYTYSSNDWGHITIGWKLDVDANQTISIDVRQRSNSGSVTAQMWTSGSSHHSATMLIQPRLRDNVDTTQDGLTGQDTDTRITKQETYDDTTHAGTTWTTTSTAWVGSGLGTTYVAGDTDETVVVEVRPMYLQQTSGWMKVTLWVNGVGGFGFVFYTDTSNHWRRTSRKFIFNLNAGCKADIELAADVSAGTGSIHGSTSYSPMFVITPYPQQNYIGAGSGNNLQQF